MSTYALILRTNRTIGKKKLLNSQDEFEFEEGTYFIQRQKVFLDTNYRGKIKPTLLYLEGVAEPIYLDNFSLKQYYEKIPIIDKNTNKPLLDNSGNIVYEMEGKKFKQKLVKKLEDIFIDARAIHNMANDKILRDLSNGEDFEAKDLILIILGILTITLIIVGFFL